MQQATFEVHLKDDDAGESPVTSDRLDFYDSGVWVQTEAGRVFYPYGRILKISEIESPTEESAEGSIDDEPAGIEYEK